MGNCGDKVQKNYKPPQGPAAQSQIQNSQIPPIANPQSKRVSSNNNSLNAGYEQPKEMHSNISKDKNNSSTLNIQQSNITRKQPSMIKEYQQQRTQKNLHISQSSIKLIYNSAIRSEILASALSVQGFEGDEFKGKKIKKFNIEAKIPEKDLIKESNYFDESNGDYKVKAQTHTKFADFRVGNFQQINTFPVKTYLFDHTLNDRLVA